MFFNLVLVLIVGIGDFWFNKWLVRAWSGGVDVIFVFFFLWYLGAFFVTLVRELLVINHLVDADLCLFEFAQLLIYFPLHSVNASAFADVAHFARLYLLMLIGNELILFKVFEVFQEALVLLLPFLVFTSGPVSTFDLFLGQHLVMRITWICRLQQFFLKGLRLLVRFVFRVFGATAVDLTDQVLDVWGFLVLFGVNRNVTVVRMKIRRSALHFDIPLLQVLAHIEDMAEHYAFVNLKVSMLILWSQLGVILTKQSSVPSLRIDNIEFWYQGSRVHHTLLLGHILGIRGNIYYHRIVLWQTRFKVGFLPLEFLIFVGTFRILTALFLRPPGKSKEL